MRFAFPVNNMTENWLLFLRGLVVGISIAAPVGPIGVLCIRRTLVDGKLTGFLFRGRSSLFSESQHWFRY